MFFDLTWNKKEIINKKSIFIVILALILVLIFALPILAQEREILLRTSRNMVEIEAWWDKLWDTTFNPPPISAPTSSIADNTGIENTTNLSLYAFVNPVRFLLAIGLTFWLFNFGFKMYEAKGMAQGIHNFFQLFLPVLIAILFLSRQAVYSRILAYGLRDIANSWSNGVMELTIADFNVRTAIQDALVTEDAKELIVQKWETCQAMPQPEVTIPGIYRPGRVSTSERLPPGAENPPIGDGGNTPPPLPPPPPVAESDTLPLTIEQRQVYDYLDCLRELSYFAEAELYRAEEERLCSGFVCQSFKTLYTVFFNIGTVTYEEELSKRLDEEVLSNPSTVAELDRMREERLDPNISEEVDSQLQDLALNSEEFLGNIVNPSKPFLYFTQWMWISALEMALFLLALFAPMFIAVSMIPNRQNLFNVWLIEFLTIGLAKLAYMTIIAIVAVQLADPQNFSMVLDNTFFMSLGIFAPAVSFAVVTTGGIAAAFSYSNQSVGAVAVAGSAFSGAFATLGYTLARNYDKRR